jgi:hypothetical protein
VKTSTSRDHQKWRGEQAETAGKTATNRKVEDQAGSLKLVRMTKYNTGENIPTKSETLAWKYKSISTQNHHVGKVTHEYKHTITLNITKSLTSI